MSYAWVTNSRTKLQAQLDGEKIEHWPEPCETCGAQWKLTPKGRWLIIHTEESGPLSFPRQSEPKRLKGLIQAPKDDAA